MDDVFSHPTFAIPFLRHLKTSVKDVDVVVTHQLGLVFDCGINGENKILSFVCVTKSFQISKDYTDLYVKRSGQVPGRLLSGRLRGIFEDFVFPFPVVGVKLKLIVVAGGIGVECGLLQVAHLEQSEVTFHV